MWALYIATMYMASFTLLEKPELNMYASFRSNLYCRLINVVKFDAVSPEHKVNFAS